MNSLLPSYTRAHLEIADIFITCGEKIDTVGQSLKYRRIDKRVQHLNNTRLSF